MQYCAQIFLLIGLSCGLAASGAKAQQTRLPSLNSYGTPGLIDTPTAETLPDGQLAFTSNFAGPYVRNTAAFQILPRVLGSFRYTRLDRGTAGGGSTYDRSFDLQFNIVDEGKYRPAIALGVRDIAGTGAFSGEYIVATKNITPRLQFSGGLGFGRFAGRDTFTNPLGLLSDSFKTRPARNFGVGGEFEPDGWFRGPSALFGGLQYQLNDQATLFAEYSTDVYALATSFDTIDIESPVNLGLQYRFKNGVDLKGFVIGGNTVGFQFSYQFNPAVGVLPAGLENAPLPVSNRGALAAASWNVANDEGNRAPLQNSLQARLATEGIVLEGLDIRAHSATIRIQNNRWDIEAQAVGRATRVMAVTLPPEIETLSVVLQSKGVPISKVTTARSDLERYQYDYDGAWQTYTRARIEDASELRSDTELAGLYPKLTYGLKPYVATSLFDPNSPLRLEVGGQLNLAYQPRAGLTFSGQFRYPLAGNIGTSNRTSDSVLPAVRSNAALFSRESDFHINKLTAEYIGRVREDVFTRFTAGYLENMFGGVSAEVLWAPVGSRLALGAEVNYARQRNFDRLLGFQDYDVVTGHASAYYDFGNGFVGQIDAGRYLAGDWGGTFTLAREFDNGFKIGGFFTLTDVSAEDFGEGSFDKGINITVPVSWLTGKPSKNSISRTIRPILRDGGARLNVSNRLYGVIRSSRGKELRDGWGRYLR